MKRVVYNALWNYFKGQLEKHRVNVHIHADNPTGVAVSAAQAVPL